MLPGGKPPAATEENQMTNTMFQEALRSLRECRDHIRDPLSDDGEHNARAELIALIDQMHDESDSLGCERLRQHAACSQGADHVLVRRRGGSTEHPSGNSGTGGRRVSRSIDWLIAAT